jgi:hypothetical protein
MEDMREEIRSFSPLVGLHRQLHCLVGLCQCNLVDTSAAVTASQALTRATLAMIAWPFVGECFFDDKTR